MTTLDRELDRWRATPALQMAFADFSAYARAMGAAIDCHVRAQLHGHRNRVTQFASAEDVSGARRNWLENSTQSERLLAPIFEREPARLVCWFYGHVDNSSNDTVSSLCSAIRQHRDVDTVLVRISCPGGIAGDAMDLARLIAGHRARTIAIVDREAMSAGALVAVAADQLWMRSDAVWMTHRSEKFAHGNRAALCDAMRELDQVDNDTARFIAARRHRRLRANLRDLMNEERVLGAREALEAGIADRVIHSLRAHAPAAVRPADTAA